LINFGTIPSPSYIGTVANANPWEFLHKVRFGHPGSPMPSTDLLRWSAQSAADIGVYSASLPQ
jgi:thiosulfate dehydrogenase